MATLQEYCETLSTSQLQALLQEECAGRGSMPTETILMVCDILSRRNPTLPSLRDTLIALCHAYLP